MRGVYAGSFDPPTRGHINIIQRAARLCDELLIGVGDNISKTYMFSKEERVRLVSAATESLSNTEVLAFDGLLADFCVEIMWTSSSKEPGTRLTPATSRRWPRPYTTYPEFR